MDIKLDELLSLIQTLQSTKSPKPAPEPAPQKKQITPEQSEQLDKQMKNAGLGTLFGVLAELVSAGHPGLEKQAQVATGYAQNALTNAKLTKDESVVAPQPQTQQPQQQLPAGESAVETPASTEQTVPPVQPPAESDTQVATAEDLIQKKKEEATQTGNFTLAQLNWIV